jgi:protein XRP2
VNCRIFIGPVDGSVFIRDSKDCTCSIAARQLRTRDCKDLHISLYCATQPSIETSTNIVFRCVNIRRAHATAACA